MEGPSWFWICMLTIFLIISLYSVWPFIRYYRLLALPGPVPLPFFGNVITAASSPGIQYYHQENFNKYGKKFRIFSARCGEIVTKDLGLIKEILLKNFWSFPNRRQLGIKAPNMERALPNLLDSDWKHSRGMITPTFSAGKLKNMMPLIHRAANNLLKKMDDYGKTGKPTQLRDVFGGFIMETIASTAFGLDLESQNDVNKAFLQNAKNTFGDPNLFSSPSLLCAIFFPFSVPLLNYFKIGLFPREKTEFFVGVTNQAIEMRKESSDKRVDFLHLMLKAHELNAEQEVETLQEDNTDEDKLKQNMKGDTQKLQPFTNSDILSHSLIFFLAGYETTNTALCLTAYLLATNPEVQKKLVEEVDAITEGREDFSYETLKDLPYLDMVFSESLRIFPPISNFDREAIKDVSINDIYIPRGTIISISTFSIHHDPENYPDPEKFIPERFTKEEKEKRNPLAYLPFGYGLRNCIGMRFAILEAKLALVRVLQKLTFDTCEQTQIPPKLGGTGFSSPPDGVILNLVPRKKTD